MTRIKWREVSKFLSGAALALSLFNFNLWRGGLALPVLNGDPIAAPILGGRAVVLFVLFVVFLYFGWLRKS